MLMTTVLRIGTTGYVYHVPITNGFRVMLSSIETLFWYQKGSYSKEDCGKESSPTFSYFDPVLEHKTLKNYRLELHSTKAGGHEWLYSY